MVILVTGVAGFIGSNLAEHLIKDYDIIGVDNFDLFYDRKLKERNLFWLKKQNNFRFFEYDVDEDISKIKDLLDTYSIKAVIHLAAKAGVRPSIEDPIGYVKANVDATTKLLNAVAAKGIERALDWIKKQHAPCFEIFNLGESTTTSLSEMVAVIEKKLGKKMAFSDSRIKLLPINKNVGVAEARNIGVANAVGRYIAIIDSDDMWVENKLEQQIKDMEN